MGALSVPAGFLLAPTQPGPLPGGLPSPFSHQERRAPPGSLPRPTNLCSLFCSSHLQPTPDPHPQPGDSCLSSISQGSPVGAPGREAAHQCVTVGDRATVPTSGCGPDAATPGPHCIRVQQCPWGRGLGHQPLGPGSDKLLTSLHSAVVRTRPYCTTDMPGPPTTGPSRTETCGE